MHNAFNESITTTTMSKTVFIDFLANTPSRKNVCEIICKSISHIQNICGTHHGTAKYSECIADMYTFAIIYNTCYFV